MKLDNIYNNFRLHLAIFFIVNILSCSDAFPITQQSTIASFAIPKQIVVSVKPYLSVDAALADANFIDWELDNKRAQAIRLAYAARELQTHLAQININVTITSFNKQHKNSSFIIGIKGQDAIVDLKVDYSLLGKQGYNIIPKDHNIYVIANTSIGALYGIYNLLEFIGFSWDDPYKTYSPKDISSANKIKWEKITRIPLVKLRGFWIFSNDIPEEFAIWLARKRFNIGYGIDKRLKSKLGIKSWGGGHLLLQEVFSETDLFEQHPEWFSLVRDVRRPVSKTGTYYNPAFINNDMTDYFSEKMIERLSYGDLSDVDILNIWPTDYRSGNKFDQSKEARDLGNNTDNLLYFYSRVVKNFQKAYKSGILNRRVVVGGISYFNTWLPPENLDVMSELKNKDYIHIFYLNERGWSGKIDANLINRDSNRFIVNKLDEWVSIEDLNYGIVEYYNFSSFSALALNDFQYLAYNYQVLSSKRRGLFAYMHPLLKNPGPMRLTNSILSREGWIDPTDTINRQDSSEIDNVITKYFERRYGKYALDWREIYTIMSKSVENTQEMFGTNSLRWLLFQEFMWAKPVYTRFDAAKYIHRYKTGSIQNLPALFSNKVSIKSEFIGLDQSLIFHKQVLTKLNSIILNKDINDDIKKNIEDDIEWFMATASRYRLLAAAGNLYLARENNEPLNDFIVQIQSEINYLQKSSVTNDTISPVNQRAFLKNYRKLLKSVSQ